MGEWWEMGNDDTFPECPILFYKDTPFTRVKLRRTRITEGPNRRKCDHCGQFLTPGDLAWRPMRENSKRVRRYVRVCDLCMREVGKKPPRYKFFDQGDFPW